MKYLHWVLALATAALIVIGTARITLAVDNHFDYVAELEEKVEQLDQHNDALVEEKLFLESESTRPK